MGLLSRNRAIETFKLTLQRTLPCEVFPYKKDPRLRRLFGGAEWIRTASPAGFLIESRVLWQFRFLRRRRSALTEKEERTGSGLLSLEQAEPAVRIQFAPPSSPSAFGPLSAVAATPVLPISW